MIVDVVVPRLSLIFLGVLGIAGVEISADARKAEAGVPRMGVAASDGRFEGEDGDKGQLAKFVNLGLGKCHTEGIGVTEEVTFPQNAAENTQVASKRTLTSVTWVSGP